MSHPDRPHRLWTSLTLGASAALTPLAAGARTPVGPSATADLPDMSGLPGLSHVQAAESGEAGEAGLARVTDPDRAYAIRLALVDAHLRAAVEAARAGLVPDALGLAGHPEAEVMHDLRPEFEERGVSDFTPGLDALSAAIYAEAPDAEIEALYHAVQSDIAAAMTRGTGDRQVFDAMQALVKGAAIEFSEVVSHDTTDPIAALEARGFLDVARDMAGMLTQSDDPVTRAAAERSLEILNAVLPLLAVDEAPDPSVLHGAAARIEIAGLRIE